MRLEANVNTPSKNSEGCLALNVYRGTWPEQKLGRKRSLGLSLARDIPSCFILPLSSLRSLFYASVVRTHLRISGQKEI